MSRFGDGGDRGRRRTSALASAGKVGRPGPRGGRGSLTCGRPQSTFGRAPSPCEPGDRTSARAEQGENVDPKGEMEKRGAMIETLQRNVRTLTSVAKRAWAWWGCCSTEGPAVTRFRLVAGDRAEISSLRARVSELEQENEGLRGAYTARRGAGAHQCPPSPPCVATGTSQGGGRGFCPGGRCGGAGASGGGREGARRGCGADPGAGEPAQPSPSRPGAPAQRRIQVSRPVERAEEVRGRDTPCRRLQAA